MPEMGGGKQIETDSCGSEFIWEDADSRPQGNLIVGVLNSAVFQVESGTPRYHTPEGIKAYDSPSQVRRAYPRGLRAYSSLTPTVEALARVQANKTLNSTYKLSFWRVFGQSLGALPSS